ncbi:MAG: GDSL-type esterase/lipase family protein [Lachnospiraceae bacterium]|nr:GDSL-type esterase/lipase family protein [Lachnospiraceae bacterium]
MKKICMRIVAVICVLVCLVPLFPVDAKADGTFLYDHVFQADYYAQMNPDVQMVYGNDATALFSHFILYGMQEGREASPEFNVYAYASRYPDLVMTFGMNLPAYYMHYIEHGYAEGRIATVSGEAYVREEPTEKPEETVPGQTGYVSEAAVQKYFSESMFIGDSIMTGYLYHIMSNGDACEKSTLVHACVSYSMVHALSPVTPKSIHPVFQGKKMSPMQVLQLSPQVKHVFIMFGTNDLVCRGAYENIAWYEKLIAAIKKVRPDVDIHIISQTYVKQGSGKGCLTNRDIALFNVYLQCIASMNGYGYVDLANPLSDGAGNLIPSYCSDGLCHMTAPAYKVWTEVFHSYIRGVLSK